MHERATPIARIVPYRMHERATSDVFVFFSLCSTWGCGMWMGTGWQMADQKIKGIKISF
jgi:hypothetical protein